MSTVQAEKSSYSSLLRHHTVNRYACVLPSTAIHCRPSGEYLRITCLSCGLQLASFDLGCTGDSSESFKHSSREARGLHASRDTTWTLTSILPYIFVGIIYLPFTRQVGVLGATGHVCVYMYTRVCTYTGTVTYLLTYLLHGAESFLRS